MNKFFIITSWLTLLTAMLIIGVITFWMIYPYKPLVIKEIKTVNATVKSGSKLDYTIDYCKNSDLPAEVTRSFVNGVIFTVNTITTNNLTGCHKNNTSIMIPQELNSGPYVLKTIWTYKVNPIREVTITAITNTFQIEGSDYERQIDQE